MLNETIITANPIAISLVIGRPKSNLPLIATSKKKPIGNQATIAINKFAIFRIFFFLPKILTVKIPLDFLYGYQG
ncbi:MAG: hypothetical protein COB88_07955 [Flavobacteriales bacterium]|nr:MAG: hypothetical protein COB88_07955 [Flavobacteriales bacterium]